ncbi:MAG: host-nuclease inhibitor Gam family protein [Chitinophagaceae bacterium]|nr:host-nuclease inhibitor Gam family protein [Chitinophagaceae bacterium]
MKTKVRKALTVTQEQFEEAIQHYAEAERREAEIGRIIEAEVNEVLSKYEDERLCLSQGKLIAFGIARIYCSENKEALFSKRRSVGTMHGLAGFRLGTPALRLQKGTNWNNVLATLKEKLPEYVRITEEPAKALLLADRNTEKVAPVLVELGLQVVQEDLFYIEAGKAA